MQEGLICTDDGVSDMFVTHGVTKLLAAVAASHLEASDLEFLEQLRALLHADHSAGVTLSAR